MITLRDFIYLNTPVLESYLAQLAGYSVDEQSYSVSHKDVKEAKAGVQVVGGSVSTESANETQSKRLLTPPAKFQSLVDILQQENQLKTLDLVDDEVWSELVRGDMVEMQVILGVPEFIGQLESIGDVRPLMDLVKNFGIAEVTSDQETAVGGVNAMHGLLKGKPIPLIGKSAGSPNYKVFGDLARDFLKTGVPDLAGEATVLGKIQRIVPKGKSEEVFSLVSAVSGSANLSRQQRQILKSKKGKKPPASDREIVRGPALALSILAVYR